MRYCQVSRFAWKRILRNCQLIVTKKAKRLYTLAYITLSYHHEGRHIMRPLYHCPRRSPQKSLRIMDWKRQSLGPA